MKFFKRFYNVFKPHIVKFDEINYGVRRWSFMGWEYLDNNTSGSYADFWWGERHALRYCAFNALDKAREHPKFRLKPKVAFARRVE